MRKTVLVVGSMASAMLLTLTVSAPAWAHVVVSPEEVAAEDYATLTVSVPTEKEVPTTKVRVEVPDGFVLSGVQPVPGWDSSFEEDGGLITAVTFSGGEIRPREFQQFLVQAQAPKEPGEYPWKAFQTYQDGSVVEWTGPPDAEEPAPVVTVVSGGSGGQGSGSGGTSPLVYAGLGGVGVLALAALAALLVRRLIDI